MAGSTVLERTTEKSGTQTIQSETSAAEKQHNERKADFLKLLYAEEETETSNAPVQTAAPQTAPVASDAVQRIADYKSYSAPVSKHLLFEGIAYKDGALISETAVKNDPVTASAAVVTAPVESPARWTETIAAPAAVAITEEDALPTRRTMDTLRQNTVIAAAEKTGLFAGISTRAKVILAAVVCAIVLAITVICINTGIINSLDARIADLRSQIAEETIKYQDIEQQLEDIYNFEGPIQELVKQFAEANGMIRR